jgi:hypothetical protein
VDHSNGGEVFHLFPVSRGVLRVRFESMAAVFPQWDDQRPSPRNFREAKLMAFAFVVP